MPLASLAADLLLIGPSWMDPQHLIDTFGPYVLPGVALVLFIETGLLFPILPGDSLLFTLGLLTTSGKVGQPLWLVCLVVFVAAGCGTQTGYWIGRFSGPKIFRREDSRFFRQSYIDQTYAFFDKYGGRALILAQFVPIVRTYIPVAAGIGKMHYRHFLTYNIIGALVWAVGVTLLGAVLGNVAFVREHIEAMILLIIAASLMPAAVEFIRHRRQNGQARNTDYDEEHERAAVVERVNRED